MPDTAVCYALDRDAARPLFAARTPEAVETVVTAIVASAASRIDLGAQAIALHRWLTGGDDPAAGDYPLNHAVLGGKPLPAAEPLIVILKRPDMAGHVATELAAFAGEDATLAPLLAQLRAFYQAAATAGQAVILVRNSA
ncbi:MAG TPA: hypothetical protein VL096_05690 [Pirellulaceae bacterium]|nr:hypothetical protein [Pirellulaceae bacterium]